MMVTVVVVMCKAGCNLGLGTWDLGLGTWDLGQGTLGQGDFLLATCGVKNKYCENVTGSV